MNHLRRAEMLAIMLFIAAHPVCMKAQSAQFAGLSPASLPRQDEAASEVTIPAGTKVLLALSSSLNTISATSESGLYLETISSVIEQNRVVVPPGSYVQGSVIKTSRPGRVKGRAQFQFHFDKMILRNNYVVPISGSLIGLAGSRYEKKRSGALQPVDQIDKDAKTIFSSSASGAAIGALGGGATGAWQGAAIGAATGAAIVLFKRGDDIHLEAGTRVEMVFDHDVTISVSKLDALLASEAGKLHGSGEKKTGGPGNVD